MDAFAVSVCKGLAVPKVGKRHVMAVGMYFGGFQALMPLIGYLLGKQFESMITSIDHWIAFALLAIIGGNMAREALSGGDDDEEPDGSFGFKTMLPLAVATSIDALAVGVAQSMEDTAWNGFLPLLVAVFIVTALSAVIGICGGRFIGKKAGRTAEIIGGCVLIGIGVSLLI